MSMNNFESRFERPNREPDTLFERLPVVGPLINRVLGFDDRDYIERSARNFDANKDRPELIARDLNERMSAYEKEELDEAIRQHPSSHHE